ncbi:MAG: FAD-binding protein [Actinobacteria bacterium]|nr:FAD-binding protein [Actinomycetota bacterium]
MGSTIIRNWDRTRSWRPRATYHPVDETGAAEVVRQGAEQGRPLKPVGGALSWSDAPAISADAMRFDRMARIVEIDAGRKRVRVQAGARLSSVNQALAQHGLALDNFGSIVMQTVGGYLGTGSHGTGGRTPILASSVTHLRLIDGLGEVHELDDAHEPELFSAARVHLGCLGVVTEVTFQCVDAFDLEERLELVDLETALADLDRIVDDNDYVKLWWLPYTNEVQVYRFNRTDRPRTRKTFNERLDASGVSSIAFAGLMALSRTFPGITPRMNRSAQKISFKPRVRIDRSDRIIRYAGSIPRHQEAEYAIPRERAATAIDEVRRAVLAADYRVNFPMEIRFVAADDIPMSPVSGRDSCFVGAYVGSRRWAGPYFADFEALMADHDGRPHWGKSFSRTPQELRDLYPRYDDFDALRRRCDPEGVFRNSFVDRVFPA